MEEQEPSVASIKKITLGESIKSFAESLTALRDFVALVSSALSEHQQKFIDKHRGSLLPLFIAISRISKNPGISDDDARKIQEELGPQAKILRGDKGTISIEITDAGAELLERLVKAAEGIKSSTNHQRLLYRSALISLVSSAEWFLSQIIRQHLLLHQDAAGIKDKLLSLEDLKRLGSIEDAKRYLIDARIDELMRGGFDDWYGYLTEKVRLSLGYIKNKKSELVEVFQRRNVMVHNNGTVHTNYLAKVPPELRKEVTVSSTLSVSPDYLSSAIDLVETNFILIAAELWKKLEPVDERRGGILMDIAFRRLQQELWGVAEGLSFFMMNDKRQPERDQLIGTLNFWQSVKWQNRFAQVRNDIENADFSAKDSLYQAARFALLDNEKEFFAVLPDVFRAKKLDMDKLATWPIFKEMRKSPLYQEFVLLANSTIPSADAAPTENSIGAESHESRKDPGSSGSPPSIQ
jgi:hypothetical protein